MTERGICMTAPNALAIRERRKTQTRRRIKLNIAGPLYLMSSSINPQWGGGPPDIYFCDSQNIEETCQHLFVRCPYVPGDLLYIREACWMWGAWCKNGFTATGRQRWRFKPRGDRVVYERPAVTAKRDGSVGWVYRHARYMPKRMARTWVRITDVRVQQVQELDNNEALAEGTPDIRTIDNNWDMRDCFGVLWDDIHGPGAWERNDWVWALTFKLIEKETAHADSD